ncbi:MAG: hypothetical protein J3R72DRAFT_240407 [Linnemannia gamsii]|nr:MAG: hypothetical protein J3R72DRAFT_240407 [Linnemannia gamsii]
MTTTTSSSNNNNNNNNNNNSNKNNNRNNNCTMDKRKRANSKGQKKKNQDDKGGGVYVRHTGLIPLGTQLPPLLSSLFSSTDKHNKQKETHFFVFFITIVMTLGWRHSDQLFCGWTIRLWFVEITHQEACHSWQASVPKGYNSNNKNGGSAGYLFESFRCLLFCRCCRCYDNTKEGMSE